MHGVRRDRHLYVKLMDRWLDSYICRLTISGIFILVNDFNQLVIAVSLIAKYSRVEFSTC